MTAPTEQFTAYAQAVQDATATAVRTWTDNAKQYSEHVTIENPLPHPAEVHTAVDAWFDLVAGLLAEQRAFTKSLIDAGTEAVGTVTEQARNAATSIPANPFVPAAEAPAAPKKARASRSTNA